MRRVERCSKYGANHRQIPPYSALNEKNRPDYGPSGNEGVAALLETYDVLRLLNMRKLSATSGLIYTCYERN